MSTLAYHSAISFVQSHGYALVFLVMLVEGPIIATAAGFAASQGYFNLYLIITLSFLGNQVLDVLLFFFARWSGPAFVVRFGRFIRLTPEKMREIAAHADAYGDTVVLMGKLTPFAALATIYVLGAARYRTTRFLGVVTTINVVAAVTFTLLGFYLGVAYSGIAGYVNFVTAAIIVICLSAFILPKVFARAERTLEQRARKDAPR